MNRQRVGIERFYEEIAVVVFLLGVERLAVIECRRALQRRFDVAVFEDRRAEARGTGCGRRAGEHFGEFGVEFAGDWESANDGLRESGEFGVDIGADLATEFLVVVEQVREADAVAVEFREHVVFAVGRAAEDLAGVVGEAAGIGTERFGGEEFDQGGFLVGVRKQRLQKIDLRFHFAEQFLHGAELGDAVVAVFVLEEAGELDAAGGMLVAAFQQHLARAERDGADVGGDLRQRGRLLGHKFFPHAAGGREADPGLVGELGSGGDLGGVDSRNERGQRRIAAGKFAQDDVTRRRRGLGQDVQEILLFLRERLAVFEVLDGLFREKFVETRDHGERAFEAVGRRARAGGGGRCSSNWRASASAQKNLRRLAWATMRASCWSMRGYLMSAAMVCASASRCCSQRVRPASM